MWLRSKVSYWNGDLANEVLVDSINVELELGGDGNDGLAIGNGSSDELQDRLVMRRSAVFPHQIDLVLEDDDVVQLHDLDGSKMFTGLRLRARFVSSDQKQCSVHDGST